MKTQEIKPNKDYNLTEVVDQELMGQGKSYFICKNIITDELWKPERERVLKATRVGEGKRSTYFIKGKNLIKYLKKQEQ